jgi:hypothetical protein
MAARGGRDRTMVAAVEGWEAEELDGVASQCYGGAEDDRPG